jgi:hypothetical protein
MLIGEPRRWLLPTMACSRGSPERHGRRWQHRSRHRERDEPDRRMEDVVTSPEVGDQELTAGEPTWDNPDIYWRAVSEDSGYGFTYPPPAGYTVKTQAELQAMPAEPVGTAYTYGLQVYLPVGGVDPEVVEGMTWYVVVATAYATPPYTAGSIVPDGSFISPSPGDTAIGWFDCCKPGRVGARIMLDFVFAGCLFDYDAGDTETPMHSRTVEVLVEVEPIARRRAAAAGGAHHQRPRASATRRT